AGESGCAPARNGGAAPPGGGAIPRDPPTFYREGGAGVDWWGPGSGIRDMGDSIPYVPTGERKRRFHSASNLELARAGRGCVAVATHRAAVRACSSASVDARGCDAGAERNANGTAGFAALVPPRESQSD